MPKYRSLTSQELQELEKEFIDYLVVNSITGDDWVKLKKENLAKAEKIIDLFSDVVFEGVLRKVQYLEFRGQKVLRTFQCLADQIVMVAMEAAPESTADFNDPQFIARASTNPPEGLKIYTSSKAYEDTREMELFKMIESGCSISDGKLFKALCLSL
ncbi:MAG: DUF6495 family protein [Bacteroidota bacterium]